MNQQHLLQKAIEFAAQKHAGQFRKGSSIPYITHVIEAMEIVSRMTEDEEVRAAAVLHDTLEDTSTTKDELIQTFGQRVADLVAAESENKREDQPAKDTWLVRKQETIRHLSHASTEIRMIALGDKLSNIRAMNRDYQVIGEELWKKFNNSNSLEQGMYYGLLANAFGGDEQIRETPAFSEYVSLCAAIFSDERDGDGNLIGSRANSPEKTQTNALIFERTEDADLWEIQQMAVTLAAFMRMGETDFRDVHMQFVNEPDTKDVSWKRTEDGYALHLCAESGKHWCQVAWQLGYLLMHCLIDHLDEKGRKGISWAEELVCEATTLHLLRLLYDRWSETPFARKDPGYKDAIWNYLTEALYDKGTSALQNCPNRDELALLNEKNAFDDRLDESHNLYWAMEEGDLLRLAKIRDYEKDDLLLDPQAWRADVPGSKAVEYLCCLQEKIEGVLPPEDDHKSAYDDDDRDDSGIWEHILHPDGRADDL